MGTKLPHPILFCFYHPRHCERESIPAQPSSGRPRVLAHPLDGQTPTTAKSVQPLPNPRPPAPGSPPLSAPSDLAAPQFRKHLLQPPVSQILASLPPFSATHPFPARPGCRLRDSHCEAQAPRERPERSLRMAGSDTGLPGSFRGNGGWRPLKRDQSRPAESAELGGGESPERACLPVFKPCRSPYSIALGFVQSRDPAWLRAPRTQLAPAPPPPVRVIYTRTRLRGRFPIRNIDPGRGPRAASIPLRLGI